LLHFFTNAARIWLKLSNIEADLRALKWMKGTILGRVVALVVKARDADGQR
jgi:hypothetical protein